MSPFQSYTAAHVIPVPLPLPRRLVARRLAAQCRGLRRPGGRHRGRVAGRRRHHCTPDQRCGDSGHAECTQSCVPALDGCARGTARLTCRQLLDLARDHVRARPPHVAGVPQRRRGAERCGNSDSRRHQEMAGHSPSTTRSGGSSGGGTGWVKSASSRSARKRIVSESDMTTPSAASEISA